MTIQMRLGEQLKGSVPAFTEWNDEAVKQESWSWTHDDPDVAFTVILSGELSEHIQVTNNGRPGSLSLTARSNILDQNDEPVRSFVLAETVLATMAEAERLDVEWTEPGPPEPPPPEPGPDVPDRPDPV
jgi:hypothetical protein